MVPFGQGRRSRKSRARAVGAPARRSCGARRRGHVQVACASSRSQSHPRVHPLRPDSGIFGTKPRNGDPASRSRRGFFPGGARYSAPRAEAARRARGGGLRCGRGRGPLWAGPAPPFVGASRRPTPPPRRIPHRYAVSVLPARPHPLRLVARPFWAVPHGSARRSLAGSPGGGAARPPTRDGGRTRRGPRASGVAAATPGFFPHSRKNGAESTRLEETRPRCREGRAEADRRPASDRVAKRSLPSGIAKQDREGGKPFPNTGGKRTRAAWRMGSR